MRAPHLAIDKSVCAGCRACELACSFHRTRTYDPASSCIWVDKDESLGEDTPHVCVQCEEGRCIAACPTGALSRDASGGATRFLVSLCVGCEACVTACDGYLRSSIDTGVPLVCDLCGGAPACAKRCPTAAILYVTPGRCC